MKKKIQFLNEGVSNLYTTNGVSLIHPNGYQPYLMLVLKKKLCKTVIKIKTIRLFLVTLTNHELVPFIF